MIHRTISLPLFTKVISSIIPKTLAYLSTSPVLALDIFLTVHPPFETMIQLRDVVTSGIIMDR